MPGATLKEVARAAGVAPATVSRVLNGAEKVASTTRQRVFAAIKDLDYAPNVHAANLRRRNPQDQSASVKARSDDGVLARQLSRLRRDLDRLREHTERIQKFVDLLQNACSQ